MPVTKVSFLQPAVKVVEIEDYTEYIAMCHKRVTETKYFEERGLSNEIVERFCLGYDPNKKLIIALDKDAAGRIIVLIVCVKIKNICKCYKTY